MSSLRALAGQVENEALKSVMSAVKDDVSEGKSLGEALQSHPKIFSKLYINMIKAGESSGKIGVVLERLADFIEYQVAMKGQIVSTISYPAIMILASSGIISFLFISIVPKLQKVFENLRVKLPWYTNVLIALSEALQRYWYVLIILGLLFIFVFKKYAATPAGRAKLDKLILKIPLFGEIILRNNISRFTRTLSTLLNSGVPIIQSLEITKNIISNTQISDVINQAKISVQEGDSLAATLDRSGQFPPLVVHMTRTGEQTGELEAMLGHVADAYEAEVQRKIATFISFLEPLMIIVLGGIVVVIVLALLLPMMSVMNQMR